MWNGRTLSWPGPVPPVSAWRLADGWDKAELRLVPLSGHALSEPGISAELVRVMDDLSR